MLKRIINFPGYFVDKNGIVYSQKQNKTKIIKQWLNQDGYARVSLSKNNIQYNFLVSRLVAIHFIDNPNNLPQVNHINKDKLCNKVENLEWCINLYNQQHSWKNGRKAKGKSKNLKEKNEIISQLYEYYSTRQLGRMFGLNQSTVSRIIKMGDGK